MPHVNIKLYCCITAGIIKYFVTTCSTFRNERLSLSRLDKLLSEKSKIRRRRQNQVNIKVTLIVWLIEFFASCLLWCIPSLFGHGQLSMAIFQTYMILLYFALLPFSYMINCINTRVAIVDGSWFAGIRGIFSRNNEILPE